MEILDTDVFEFELRYVTTDIAANNTLLKDVMFCTVKADPNAKGYWVSSVVDRYARTINDVLTVRDDANSALPNNGQDWFIPDTDVNMNIHLCDATDPATAYFDCTAIRCHARRKLATEDTDDF